MIRVSINKGYHWYTTSSFFKSDPHLRRKHKDHKHKHKVMEQWGRLRHNHKHNLASHVYVYVAVLSSENIVGISIVLVDSVKVLSLCFY